MKRQRSEIRSQIKKYIIMFLGFILAILFNSFALADSVTLEWDANTEADLDGYCLYRAERIGDHSTAWEKIATIPKDVSTYTDEVDKKNYAWMITAFDISGNTSFPSNMVERYDRTAPGFVQNLRK